ncbi:MAG: hypothetical protein PHD13_00245 [Methanocellales archaeon]|nr:hypothetical protein [Methanocellales archaeon]MDD3291515.1 hypothetical protein [Methanocellales archaeon]MDD5234595.1 hypothetical protein [Methanocellales archaeon]MDD5485052.1 hypothetical protein [Methanocellales archaeon]
MGENDSSTLMLGAMCWLLGEEKAKKLARSVGRISGEYKRTVKELELGLTEQKIVPPDMETLARSFGIDTEDKPKKEVLGEIRGKVMERQRHYDYLVDPFGYPEEYVPVSPPVSPPASPSEESPSEESPSEESPSEESPSEERSRES